MENNNDFKSTMVTVNHKIPIKKYDITDSKSFLYNTYTAIRVLEKEVTMVDYSNINVSLNMKENVVYFSLTVRAMRFVDNDEEEEYEDDEDEY